MLVVGKHARQLAEERTSREEQLASLQEHVEHLRHKAGQQSHGEAGEAQVGAEEHLAVQLRLRGLEQGLHAAAEAHALELATERASREEQGAATWGGDCITSYV